MKRTLTFWLLLALAAGAVAQTPTVVEKPSGSANSTAKPAAKTTTPAKPASSAKPSPATVKVGATAAQKTSVAAKPAVVAVQPANAKAMGVSAVKSTPTANISRVPAGKTSVAPAAKVVPVTAVKANSTVKPVVGVKPAVPAVPVAAKTVTAGSTAHVAVAPKAGMAAVKAGTTVAAKETKDPFSGKNTAKAGLAKVQAAPGKATAAVVAVKDEKPAADKKPVARKVDAAGRRDPFVSPVVNMGAVGSGCSTGKRCLAIEQIALRGVVKSDAGMIAVVVNAMDKAYFLRENDPVFDGYVVKITGDSVVFKETFRDKLGKPLTRDVTKTISRPVA